MLIIDDGSTDGSFDCAPTILDGYPDATATLLRNEATLGLGLIPLLLRHAKGRVIIQADSDDIALPGGMDAILDRLAIDPTCRLVTSNAAILSPESLPIGLLETAAADWVDADPELTAVIIGSRHWIGATQAFERSLLEDFPALDPELCHYGLDLLLPFRATPSGTHQYIALPLEWRQHARNTHRLAGDASAEAEAGERYIALEFMVLAQRRRDLAAWKQRSPDDGQLGRVALVGEAMFHRHSDLWVCSRDRLMQRRAGTDGGSAPWPRVAVPPMVTCTQGAVHKCNTASYDSRTSCVGAITTNSSA